MFHIGDGRWTSKWENINSLTVSQRFWGWIGKNKGSLRRNMTHCSVMTGRLPGSAVLGLAYCANSKPELLSGMQLKYPCKSPSSLKHFSIYWDKSPTSIFIHHAFSLSLKQIPSGNFNIDYFWLVRTTQIKTVLGYFLENMLLAAADSNLRTSSLNYFKIPFDALWIFVFMCVLVLLFMCQYEKMTPWAKYFSPMRPKLLQSF